MIARPDDKISEFSQTVNYRSDKSIKLLEDYAPPFIIWLCMSISWWKLEWGCSTVQQCIACLTSNHAKTINSSPFSSFFLCPKTQGRQCHWFPFLCMLSWRKRLSFAKKITILYPPACWIVQLHILDNILREGKIKYHCNDNAVERPDPKGLSTLKVHKIENFFDSDFGICVISLLVMSKY